MDRHSLSSDASNRFGRNSNIFQPPQSPATSSSNDYFSPHRSRKRARPASVDERHTAWNVTTPSATPAAQSWIQCPTPGDQIYGSAGDGGSGLVNERYMLRDGFDTPGLMAGGMEHEGREYIDQRGKMREKGSTWGRSDGSMLSGPLAKERNGVARTRSNPDLGTSEKQQGWAGFAFGLVGKVFSFGTGVFRGFYAGGGQGYDVSHTSTPTTRGTRPRLSRGHTPVPGAWQEDDFLGDFEQDNPSPPAPASASRLPNKRRQTDKDAWVMVGTPDLADTSPRRKVSSSSIPRSNLAPFRPSASRASSRRSIAPISRRQSAHVSQTGSPALDTRPRVSSPTRRASVAPMRSNSRPSSAHDCVSPEAERFRRKQAKQDRAADKAMSSMSKQLQDLIRQGQQALGTRFDVEGEGGYGGCGDEDMDEGFVDEDGVWR